MMHRVIAFPLSDLDVGNGGKCAWLFIETSFSFYGYMQIQSKDGGRDTTGDV